MPDSQNNDIAPKNGVNDAIIPNTIFSKSGKVAFPDGIGVCFFGQIFLKPPKDSPSLLLAQPREITRNRFLVNNTIGQGRAHLGFVRLSASFGGGKGLAPILFT